MARPIKRLEILPSEREELERRVRDDDASRRDRLHARIVLLRAEGIAGRVVARRLGVTAATVSKWTRRFEDGGVTGLREAAGRGRKPSIPSEVVAEVVEKAAQTPPDRQRWSTRSMAEEAGVSPSSVQRIWKSRGLKPHLTSMFEPTAGTQSERWFWSVIGLYLDPPEKSIALCCGGGIQLEEQAPTEQAPPPRVGQARTMACNSSLHGSVRLFAALNYLEGKLAYRTEIERAHVEWLRFLRRIEREVPQGLDIHLIADNRCRHEHETVKKWLAKQERFRLRLAPASMSWMNFVEHCLVARTEDRAREGSLVGAGELADAIASHLAQGRERPEPYRWTASREEILARVCRLRDFTEGRRDSA